MTTGKHSPEERGTSTRDKWAVRPALINCITIMSRACVVLYKHAGMDGPCCEELERVRGKVQHRREGCMADRIVLWTGVRRPGFSSCCATLGKFFSLLCCVSPGSLEQGLSYRLFLQHPAHLGPDPRCHQNVHNAAPWEPLFSMKIGDVNETVVTLVQGFGFCLPATPHS